MKKNFYCLTLLLFMVSLCFAAENILVNGDLESVVPNFWNKMNDGDGGAACSWDLANGKESMRSLKVEKPNASTAAVGWKSVDNAYLYWNHARAERLYNLTMWAKTEGVNVNPTTDDQKIVAVFQFYAAGALLGEQMVEVDQSAASSDWTEYTGGLLIPAGADPDEMYVTLKMGKDATGTVWFDNVDCGTDPWEMGVFNGNMELVLGWMEWHAEGGAWAGTVQDTATAHSGEWSALMYEWDDNDDEIVFYSEPAPAKPNTWYKISVWAKWDSISTNEGWLPSSVTPEYINNRLGMCFFFHKAPIEKSFDLTGGDQFFYFDQRDSAGGWAQYTVVAKAPEDAAGVSCRARFNNYPVGKVWYDDFAIEELDMMPEILVNGDLETVEPNFWNKMNDGDGGAACSWDLANGKESMRSLKVEKPTASTAAVGWKSDDNAYLYWNHARAERLYNLTMWAKTEGVNVNPTTDDQKIVAVFQFYAAGALLGEQMVEVDQSAASSDWTEYTGGLLIPAGADPDEMYVTLKMGKDATGTVWFDNVDCGTDPWEMGVFNGNMELVLGWMEWHAEGGAWAGTVQDTATAHSGEWSALMYEWDDNDDEIVFYSEPAPADPLKWYKISVWAKCDSINKDENWFQSNVMTEYINNRLGMCFFFHKAPIEKSFDLTGGDQFFYFDQRDSVGDWTQYTVVAQAPEDAAGVSCRARFNNYPVGKVWYDDFSIQPAAVVPTGISDPHNYIKVDMPKEFKLSQNYPNPFNPETTVRYAVPNNSKVQIEVYNLLGRKVRSLYNGHRTAGQFEVKWDARDDYGTALASGVYLITLRSGNFVTARAITLLK